MALAPPRRDRPGLARPPPAARRDLVADGHELRRLVARGDRRAGSACSTSDGTETRHQLTERTLGIWHGELPDVPVGQLYGFRADGPWDPTHGRRFNPAKLLLDPYARAITGDVVARPGDARATTPGRPTASAATLDSAPYDAAVGGRPRRVRLGGRRPPAAPGGGTPSIYELHVKGYTQLHNEVPEHLRGTYAGLGSHDRDPLPEGPRRHRGRAAAGPPVRHRAGAWPSAGWRNYWGYNSIGFFAPHAALLARPATAASRSPSSSRWSRTSTAPASR